MDGIRKKFRNLRLRLKLALSHGGLGVLALIVMFTGLVSIKNLTGHVKAMYEGPVANTEYVANLQYGIVDLERAVNALMLQGRETYSAFEQVRRVIIDPEHHFIGLSHPFTCNMIYADDPYYPMIRDEIIKRCVNAKIRFRNRS